jgi:steroid delta-isomerase
MLARLLMLLCLAAALPAPASADELADKAAIVARLQGWADAFNARDAAGACDLFAPDLVSTVEGIEADGRDAVCARLARLLARDAPRFHYAPDIREVIVSGDLAVVRLFWTLTVTKGEAREVSREAGLDVFHRQPDGRWSIARFIAFTIDAPAAR